MKPHLRRESGHWLCTESRKERNILRGTLGDTPCQAFYYFIHRLHVKQIIDNWQPTPKAVGTADLAVAKKICPNDLVGKPA